MSDRWRGKHDWDFGDMHDYAYSPEFIVWRWFRDLDELYQGRVTTPNVLRSDNLANEENQ